MIITIPSLKTIIGEQMGHIPFNLFSIEDRYKIAIEFQRNLIAKNSLYLQVRESGIPCTYTYGDN